MGDFSEYTTRAVKMWLENTESYYTYFRALAEEALIEADDDKDAATDILADEIKEAIENGKPTEGGNLYDDILTNALATVDYYDVAECILDE